MRNRLNVDVRPVANCARRLSRRTDRQRMRWKRFIHKRTRSNNTLFADLDAAQNGAVRRNPTMVPDRDRLNLFFSVYCQIVLIRIKDPRPRTDPNAVPNRQSRLRAQMTAVQKSLAADCYASARKGEDDHRTQIGTQPSIRTNLHTRALGDGDVHAAGESLRVDARTDRQMPAGSDRKMRRREVRTRFGVEGEAGVLGQATTQSKPVVGLDRLQSPAQRE